MWIVAGILLGLVVLTSLIGFHAGPHVHVAVLVGLTMTLYSAIYLLLPILTNGARLWSQRLATFHFWAHLTGGIGMGAFMGMAGLQGMLRRTIYYEGEYQVFMILAGICGGLLTLALLAFLLNIVMTVGLRGATGIFLPSRMSPDVLLPPPPREAGAAA